MGFSKNSASSSLIKTSALTSEVLFQENRSRPLFRKNLEQENSKEEPRGVFQHVQKTHTQKTQKPYQSLEKKEEIRASLFAAVLNTLDVRALAQREPEEAHDELRDLLTQVILSRKLPLSLSEIEHLLEDICNHVLGFGPLEPLLAREDVSHIIVNGPSSTFIEVDGKVRKTSVSFKNAKNILNVCRRLLKHMGLKHPLGEPLSDLRMSDGSRVTIVLPPLSVEGPALTIHRAGKLRFGFDQLVKIGTLPEEARGLLETLRCARTNILIAGGRSSGKTMLVNCLVEGIKKEDRVIVCGEAVGFDQRRSHIVRLETRPQNFDGEGRITMQDLVKSSVRQRPQHIVVDELRGPEAFDLLQAFLEGQEGAIATVLAHSPVEALSRIEDMIFTSGCGLQKPDVREQVCRLFPIIVQTALMEDGSRKVTEIREAVGVEKNKVVLKKLFTFTPIKANARGRLDGQYTFEI